MPTEGEPQDTRAIQIDSLLQDHQRRLGEWLEKNPGAKINDTPTELYAAFVPRRVYELASDPDKVRVFSLPDEGRVRFLAYEEDYSGEQLTDPQAWIEWQTAKEEASQKSTSKMKVMPQPPETINHFHAKYDAEIIAGRLKFTDRILQESSFRQEETYPETLYVGFFDSERRKGIGKEFYQNTLPAVVKQFGVRFIVGTNTEANLSFFTDPKTGLGRISLNQIRLEFRKQFFPNFQVDDPSRDYSQYTIQFLYPEDKVKYLA